MSYRRSFPKQSEIQFQTDLNYACRDATHAAANFSEILRLNVAVQCLRIGIVMIEQIVNFGPQFRSNPLVYRKRFIHGEIAVEDTRKPDRSRARRRAEAPRGWSANASVLNQRFHVR